MGYPRRDLLTTAALKVKYKYASIDEFIRESGNDISLSGIFIEMPSPLKEGVTLQLKFELQDGSPAINGLGQVVWRREIAHSDDRPPGIGIRFLELDPASRNTVEQAVKARGVAPSRFDRLGEAAARVSHPSTQPVPKRAGAPSVIRTTGVFNSDMPSSLAPDSDTPTSGSGPVDTRPPKFSFTRVKTVSVPDQAEEPGASSVDSPEAIEPAAGAFAIAPDQRPTKEMTALAEALIAAEKRASVRITPLTEAPITSENHFKKGEPAAGASPDAPDQRTTGEMTDLARALIAAEQRAAEKISALAEAPNAAKQPTQAEEKLPLKDFDRAPVTPPITAYTQRIPQVVRTAAPVRAAIQSFRATLIRRRRELAVSAFLALLLLVGGFSRYRVLAPKAWRTARVLSGKTNQVLVTAGVELHRGAEKLGLIASSFDPSEPEQSIEHRSRRYLLKVVTQPAGATVAVGEKLFVTPGEMVLDNPKEALSVYIRRKSHRSIQRRITWTEFQPKGDFFVYTLDVRLKKLSSNTQRTKPPATAPVKKAPTFYLEPMPEFSRP
jgi:uncharacterized protein (TIGR02266 family)